jgi:hypothetical protein
MHDEMNRTSLQKEVLDQFHMNASCMVTLSCLNYIMKFKRCYSNVNLHGRLESLQTSLIDLTWLMIVNTTSIANSNLNSTKVKFFKVQNNWSIVHNFVKMSWTPTLGPLINIWHQFYCNEKFLQTSLDNQGYLK